jgi:hypothetical protein
MGAASWRQAPSGKVSGREVPYSQLRDLRRCLRAGCKIASFSVVVLDVAGSTPVAHPKCPQVRDLRTAFMEPLRASDL